jgi:hypothetical protein
MPGIYFLEPSLKTSFLSCKSLDPTCFKLLSKYRDDAFAKT